MDRDLASLSDIRRVATELMAMREKGRIPNLILPQSGSLGWC
jgi:hypothetical protein